MRGRAKLLLTLACLPVGFAACELAVRAFDLGPPRHFETRGNLFRKLDDPLQLYDNAPGAEQRVLYWDEGGSEPRTVRMRVNAQGFRGPEVARAKPAGALRIACVGDSHTFGYGVGEGDSWPDHLRELLHERSPERPVEVLNCGVNAYDTLQELLWTRASVLPFEPDVVLLQYHVNDAAARGVKRHTPPPRDLLLELSHPSRGGWVGELRSRSRFADLVLDGIYRRRWLGGFAAERLLRYEDEDPGWQRARDALRGMRDELAARGVAFGVVLYPFLVEQGGRLTSHEAFAIVAAFCEEERIPWLDPEADFLTHDVDGLRSSLHDFHGNGTANRIFARNVADWLAARGLLQRQKR